MLENEIDGPYNLEPLAALCRSKEYTPGLIIKCKASPGGMGNVRNMMLNCYRFAIEAGATGVIVPQIMKRGDSSLSDLFTGIDYPFTYFFDLDHFTTSFRAACPKIHLYESQDELADFPSTNEEHEVDAHELSVKHHPKAYSMIDEPQFWRREFYKWLNENAPPFSRSEPVLVTIPMQLLRWPFSFDNPEFVATFGRILLIRDDVRRLAAMILYSMDKTYNLSLNLSGPIQPDKFYGAHMRTASDALAVGWPGYDEQSKNYLDAVSATNLSLVYLTTGNPADAARFTAKAATKNITVVSKDTLLAGEEFAAERAEMKNLSWDHLGMIDYYVLLRSSLFGGMFQSSFSWNVANKRHVVIGNGTWQEIAPMKAGLDTWYDTEGTLTYDGPECFRDELSTIYGLTDMDSVRWQFPMALYP
ncbi:hypothetical protein LSUB1_G004426 [Lachnellula subtilissima]|uniref:Alternative oxidase n=1 Tax=Lachnellula subtilissima TaxID=602034 RepID=A0A8H8RVZ4_9HELO|nr:hypothetical protein LSUB1_G004426 [Lachnellula subtilissima]